MQRPVPVPAHERHGQEIEEPAHVALGAVSGSPVLPRPVVHRQLGDAKATVVGEHGQEAMQLAVDPQRADDLRPVGLEPAVHVVELQARDAADDGVEDLRDEPPRPRIAALRLPAGDEVEALVELREQAWDLRRVVLEVGVDRHDHGSLGVAKARRSAADLPKLRRSRTTLTFGARSWRRVERGEGAVGGAVVDEDGFPRPPRGSRALASSS